MSAKRNKEGGRSEERRTGASCGAGNGDNGVEKDGDDNVGKQVGAEEGMHVDIAQSDDDKEEMMDVDGMRRRGR
ncbi:hypothetical protein C8R44DRAFT_815182 [Mycena epipterygia]|nr:hypothetical protein C8R44DRAFT_815182 [Mycena epipterygia]